jgi:hypothetical protein
VCNAWVIGNEPCVMLDFTGAKDYAKNTSASKRFLKIYRLTQTQVDGNLAYRIDEDKDLEMISISRHHVS